MPTTTRETVLSRYRYDPLDRLSAQTDIQRFYCNNRLATEVGGGVQTSLFQHDDQLLAQRQARADKIDTTLLATDQQRSVLNALDATRPHPIAYSPYGHRPPENGLLSLLGFNGERPDPVTGHYHLGNGYRQFNPVLMRFNSPDSWSPFGKGGLNAYVYCVGDPVNFSDPTGHMLKSLRKLFGRTPDAVKKELADLYVEKNTVSSEITELNTDTKKAFDYLGSLYEKTDRLHRNFSKPIRPSIEPSLDEIAGIDPPSFSTIYRSTHEGRRHRIDDLSNLFQTARDTYNTLADSFDLKKTELNTINRKIKTLKRTNKPLKDASQDVRQT